MSIELHLGFDRHWREGQPPLLYERLKLQRRNADDLFERIKAQSSPLLGGVQWYEDEGLALSAVDCYGKPLTWIHSYVLGRLLKAEVEHPLDRALAVYLLTLPASTRVVLWWS